MLIGAVLIDFNKLQVNWLGECGDLVEMDI